MVSKKKINIYKAETGENSDCETKAFEFLMPRNRGCLWAIPSLLKIKEGRMQEDRKMLTVDFACTTGNKKLPADRIKIIDKASLQAPGSIQNSPDVALGEKT